MTTTTTTTNLAPGVPATNAEFIEFEAKYTAHNYHPAPVVIHRADGVWVWDLEDNKYLDMLAGYSAIAFGHGNPQIIRAATEQMKQLSLVSRAFHSDNFAPFARELAELCGMDYVLPMNSGAEAVETGVKCARKWAYKVKGVQLDHAEIIACTGNFHGRTTTVVSFSSTESYKKYFGPHTPGFKIVPFGRTDSIEHAITPNTAAVLLEPVQGEGGVNVPPDGYLADVRRICDENKVLMMADEVQTGMGRTGRVWACEHENVQPDMYLLGKALGGGVYPVSAVVSKKDILGVFEPGDHGSTFGGNPLACAIGMEAIRLLKNGNLAENAEKLGEYFREKVRAMNSPLLCDVRGKGLLNAVEFKTEAGVAHDYIPKFLDVGILTKDTVEQVLRFTPPLTITKDEIDWALDRIEQVLCG
jgi:ornithine--oxo-acid transaminase